MKQTKKQKKYEVTTLCAYCGTLLGGQEVWEKKADDQLETHSSPTSHGICPDCLWENFPQEYLAIQEENRVRVKNVFQKGYRNFYGHK